MRGKDHSDSSSGGKYEIESWRCPMCFFIAYVLSDGGVRCFFFGAYVLIDGGLNYTGVPKPPSHILQLLRRWSPGGL